MKEIENKIRKWAYDRKLDEADSDKQVIKLTEEVGELSEAYIKGKDFELRDAVGDIIVVLTVLGVQQGFTIEECLMQAYEEIKDRTGEMVDGVFVKSEDLVSGNHNQINKIEINHE